MKGLEEDSGTLVTGGSGYVGKRLISSLSQKQKTVVALYRMHLPALGENIFPVCSDLASEDLLLAPLRGIRSVVHLAWDNNFIGPASDFDQNKMPKTDNLSGLKNLLHAMEKAKTKRIVFVSALGAARQSLDPFLREKYWGEFLCLNSNIEERVIVRPAILFGNQSKFTESIKKVMKIPGLYPLPRIKEKLRPLNIDDLVAFLSRLATDTLKQPYSIMEICGDHHYPIAEIFKAVSDSMGRGSSFALPSFISPLIYPFLEKDKGEKKAVKLKHMLAIGKSLEECTRKENPLVLALPKQEQSFVQVFKKEKPPVLEAKVSN